MAEADKPNCQFASSLGGNSCVFEGQYQDRDIIELSDGRKLCCWHSGLSEQELSNHGVDAERYRSVLRRHIATGFSRKGDLAIEGVRFGNDLFDYVARKQISNVRLVSVTIDSPLKLTNTNSISSLTLEKCSINAEIQILGKVNSGISISGSCISKNIEIGSHVTGSFKLANSTIEGFLKFAEGRQTTIEEVSVFHTIIHGGITIPAATVERITLATNVVKGPCNIEFKKSARLSIQTTRFVNDLRILSSSRESFSEIICSRCRGKVIYVGKFGSIHIRSDSKLKAVELCVQELLSLKIEAASVMEVSATNKSLSAGEVFIKSGKIGSIDFIGKSIQAVICDSSDIEELYLVNTGIRRGILVSNDCNIGILDFSWMTGEPRNTEIEDLSITQSHVGLFLADRRKFLGNCSFIGTTFNAAPSFLETTLPSSAIFPLSPAYFTRTHIEDEPRYRYLRTQMEKLGSREMEGLFFALEKRSMRKQEKGFNWLLSVLYDWTSCYGINPWLPLVWLGVGFVVFGLGYACALSNSLDISSSIDWSLVEEGFSISVRQIFLPFFGLRLSEPDRGLFWELVWVFQSIFSVTLLAEFLLAVRWRFRRG